MFCPSLQAAPALSYRGVVDFVRQDLRLEIHPADNSPLALTIRWQGPHCLLTLNVKDLKLPLFDISALMEGTVTFLRGPSDETKIVGRLRSHYTLVDRQPLGDFRAHFEIEDDTLRIHSLISSTLSLSGFWQFAEPFDKELNAKLTALDIDNFFSFVSSEDARTALGPFSGDVRILGHGDRVEVKGKLATYQGQIDGLPYEQMRLNFEGVYPIITINRSHIIQPDGSIFNISGRLNLAQLEHFNKQVRDFISEPLVEQEGEDLEWTLKRIHQNGGDSSSELKYLLRKESGPPSKEREEGAIFGLERQMKF